MGFLMAIKVTLACPDCAHTWATILKKGEEYPSYCPACGVFVGADEDFVPSKVTISTALGRSGDATYREIERTSEVRAEAAGDHALKITNMRDGLREGDIAAMPVNNAVSRYADEAHSALGFNYFQGSPQGELARANSGPDRASTGGKALSAIQGGKGIPVMPQASKLIRGNWGGG